MKRIKSPIEQAMVLNNNTYIDIYERLKLLATSIFTWENLDDLCGDFAARFLEQNLFDYGRAVIVKDDTLGPLSLRANPSDTFNVYMMPTRVNAWSLGYSKDYSLDEVVYIQNNELERPTAETTSIYAYRLYNADRVSDVNLNAQKTPVLIEGDTKSIMTLKQVYEQYQGNSPFIFGNKDYDLQNKLNVLTTGAPYVVRDITDHKKQLLSEYLQYLGIENFSSEKKERLVGDEAKANEQVANFYFNCFYKTRVRAAEKINELFKPAKPVSIEVDLREIEQMKASVMDILEQKQIKSDIIEGREERNGEVHNNNSASDGQ